MTVNCIYVPLLTAAARAADELSIAAVTRGIERPGRRSCLVEIRMRGADWGSRGRVRGVSGLYHAGESERAE